MSAQELQKIISPYFTEEVLLDMVRKKSGFSDIKVKHIKINTESDLKKGDSYLSSICRFTVDAIGKNAKGEEESVFIPVIVKYVLKNIGRRKTYRSAEYFENEIMFYDKVWTAFEKFQNKGHIKEKFDNIPFALAYHYDGTNDFVAMVDLGHYGFKSAQRGAGLDWEHTIGILQTLARFHALSLAFKERSPNEFEAAVTNLKETYFAERLRPWYSNFQQTVFDVVRDAVQKELPEYLPRLEKLFKGDMYGLAIRSCHARGPLSVVNHGDVWVPNFLIKYDGDQLEEIAVIDFHINLVENKWSELVEFYHKTLTESMAQYGAKCFFGLDAIHQEIKEHSVVGVGISMEALIMTMLEDDEVNDLDAIQGDEAVPLEQVWIVYPFKEREKRQRIAAMIKIAMDKNFI